MFVALTIGLFALSGFSCMEIPIGGLFEDDVHEEDEIAFRAAVDMFNAKTWTSNITFRPVIGNIAPEQVLESKGNSVVGVIWERPHLALESACKLIEKGVAAVITSSYDNNANAIRSICDAKEIPFIRSTADRVHEEECCSINIFPSIQTLSQAAADLVIRWNWNNFSIIYESYDSMANIAQLLKLYNSTGYAYTLFQLKRTNEFGWRDSFKILRASGQTEFVLHCEIENLDEILLHAQQVGMMMRKYKYLILNVDAHTVDVERYQDSLVNITSLRLIDPANPVTIRMAELMIKKKKELGLPIETENASLAAHKILSTSALTFDALTLLTMALSDIGNVVAKPFKCNESDSWEHGSTIFNYMKMMSFRGITGPVRFNRRGFRKNFQLEITELHEEDGFVKIGSWNSDMGLKINRPPSKPMPNSEKNPMRNASLVILIRWAEPYAFYRNETYALKGNDQFDGFIIDLIKEMAASKGFNYKLIRNEMDKNGDYDPKTNKWDGMIGDLLAGKADIAIGDIAITRQRKEFVDFTAPFMTFGTQILYRKPDEKLPEFFNFANPFEPSIWLGIGISYVVVSGVLFIMAHVSPIEWENCGEPCTQNSRYTVKEFTLRNSLWFVLATLVQMGAGDLAPRSNSTRILSSTWAFLILIIVSTYKAQLAAFLTVELNELPFKDFKELVERAETLGIRYGAVKNEANHAYFKVSSNKLHQTVAAYMDSHPENMVEENYEGADLAIKESYAFFTDSVFAEFVTKVVCNMVLVGDVLNDRQFAIALPKGSPYRTPLSESILRLKENGRIDELKKYWWEEKFKVDCSEKKSNDPAATPLNLHHVAGIFWLTVGLSLVAAVFAFFELALITLFRARKSRSNFFVEYKRELGEYVKFKGSTRCICPKNRPEDLLLTSL